MSTYPGDTVGHAPTVSPTPATSAGSFEYTEEKGRRILRGLAFVQEFPEDSAWAHPVDCLVYYVDVVDK